jgi:peroxidase
MASSSVSSCLLLLLCLAAVASAQLSPTFYDTSCPNALSTIKSAVNAAVQKENRMGASLLRLHFHDCFVQASSAHSFPSFDRFLMQFICRRPSLTNCMHLTQ